MNNPDTECPAVACIRRSVGHQGQSIAAMTLQLSEQTETIAELLTTVAELRSEVARMKRQIDGRRGGAL